MDKPKCMDCGTPFCHWACPLGNYIPEWNDAVSSGGWKTAFELLSLSNNLPEVTGRICPSLCESACVLGKFDDPMSIKDNELAIIEYAFKSGLIKPRPPEKRTNKKVAVIGSGPAGLSCAAELNQLGYQVTVYEKDEKPGGIMRFGIPEFKLEKWILDRRIDLWEKEGVEFKCGIKAEKKDLKDFDAVCIAIGSRVPRDLKIPGRELSGIYFAMDYLIQPIDSKGKKVVVIGGGDTGADCVGTAIRRGALSVTQIEIMPKPAKCKILEDGVKRMWEIQTQKFKAQAQAQVGSLICSKTNTKKEFEIETDIIILAMGFLHPEQDGLLSELKVEYDKRGNIKSIPDPKIFSAGDCRRGQSLIVWAIWEGRRAAVEINRSLL